MSSDLISIAASGISAARTGMDVTAQNIANAATPGYVRRSTRQIELTAPESASTTGAPSMSGVTVTGVTRNAQDFLQNEVNTTAANAARANGLVTNLTTVESAVEDAGVYSAIGTFQAALQTLANNPTDPSQRASVLADAQTMAQSFNLAGSTLATAQQTMQADAASSVTQINQIASSLARLNVQISGDANVVDNGPVLLDQRDALLQQLSALTDATTTYGTGGTVSVTLGGAAGRSLVNGGTAGTLSLATAADGTVTYALGGATIAPAGGAIAADQQGLGTAATARAALDGIAGQMMTAVNTAQAGGSDLTGAAGTAIFSGTGAADMAVTMTSGSKLATARAGAPANSTDIANLTAIQAALSGANPAGQTNALLFNLSSGVQTATTAQTALTTIAAQAKTRADSTAGVDLNTEAANLLQYQQAFQASAKVIQTAETIFQQLLAIN